MRADNFLGMIGLAKDRDLSTPAMLTVRERKFSLEVIRVGQIHLWLALGVAVSTAATDAVYVMFSAAVAGRRRVSAATWSSLWYLLSAFAVISYTRNWVYVCFAAIGSWVGAYLSMSFLRRPNNREELGRGEPRASA